MGRPVKAPQLLIGVQPNPNVAATPLIAPHIGGGPGSPTQTGLLKMQSDFNGAIGTQINWFGGSLGTAPTIYYSWSPDGVTFFIDNSAPSYCTTVTPGPAPGAAVHLGPYIPPVVAKAATVTIINKDNARDITILSMGGSIDYIVGTFGAVFGGGD